jgi:putative ABC transport system ATP-binding protein
MKSSTGRSAILQERSTIIDLRHVVKIYGGNSDSVVALNSIDLAISEGEFLVVCGKSGSGKTTLVNIVTGLDRCNSGEVRVAGAELHRLGPERAAHWRRRTIGVVFQSFELLPTLTALENVMLPMDFAHTFSRRDQARRALELLEQVDIAEHAGKEPAALSGGQQQRLAIARAMANNPSILVADEPTGSLDSATAEDVMSIFDNLITQGKTILMVTHDKEIAAHGSRLVMIADGRIIGSMTGDGMHA